MESAIEAEVSRFMERFSGEKTAASHQRVVRNSYLPARQLQTGVGAVEVSVPRVRDREQQIRFTSSIPPP